MYILFLVVRSFVDTVRMDGWMDEWMDRFLVEKERKKETQGNCFGMF